MKFKFDPRELPDNLKSPEAEKAFTDSVLDLLQDSASGVQPDASLFAAIVGMLVLDGATDPSAASFDNAFWTVRGESAGSTDSSEPSNPKLPPKPNKEMI